MSVYDLETEGYLGNGEYDGEATYGQQYEEEFGAGSYELEQEEEFGAGGYELEQEEEFGAGGYELEQEEEFGAGGYELGQAAEFETEMERYAADLQELSGEYESPLDEVEEMELATRLLEIQDEEELEQFLGKLLSSVARRAGGFLQSKSGKALGGILKNVAKTALPVVGGALGSVVAPGVGTAVGGQLGTLATRLFEVELEGMEPEDQEFEVARRYVRLAATAGRNAALARRRANPRAVARGAALAASRRHAPGVYRRFRVFARPAPFYWPQPIPVYAPPPEPAPAPPPAAAAPTQEPGQPPADEPAADEPAGELDGEGWYGEGGYGRRGGNGNGGRARSGRWVRRGRRLIVLGI
jgi:uncharacterized protein (DUF697 family)